MLKRIPGSAATLTVLLLAACNDERTAVPPVPSAPATVASSTPAPPAPSKPGEELAANNPVRAEVQPVLDAQLTRELEVVAKVKVEILRGEGPWVFVSGLAMNPAGADIDFSTTSLAEPAADGMIDGNTVTALLRKAANGTWEVVEFHIGPTDVPQIGWPQDYHVSPALVGMEG